MLMMLMMMIVFYVTLHTDGGKPALHFGLSER